MLPYGRQNIEEDDIDAVAEALRGDFLTTGPKVAEFEKAICELTGASYAVACSNGTTALHLASMALDLKQGDCVIVPTLTFLATANAVRYCNADVVFSDVNPDTGLMEADHLEAAIKQTSGKNLKAVFPVHLAGQCVDIEALKPIADKHGIKIVADSCHALGGRNRGEAVGSCAWEDMATFSFHPVKTIAAGEGGAITTNNKAYADKMRLLRSHAMNPLPEQGAWFYEMEMLGYNYRITDFQCALGLSQLKKIKRFAQRRKALFEIYNQEFVGLAPEIKTPIDNAYCDALMHLYPLRIDFDHIGISRNDLMLKLRDRGIGTQVHYIPVHTQPYYQKLYGEIDLPGARAYYERTLSIPFFSSMKDEDAVFVANEIKKIIRS